MQSRIIINGKEVESPVLQRLVLPIVMGILALLFFLFSILFVSVIGIGLAVGAGLAGLGIGSVAVRRMVLHRRAETHALPDRVRALPESGDTDSQGSDNSHPGVTDSQRR